MVSNLERFDEAVSHLASDLEKSLPLSGPNSRTAIWYGSVDLLSVNLGVTLSRFVRDIHQMEAGRIRHTIWAKKRLRELQAEIDTEMRDNVESVGLEMALQEQQWIVDHFGLVEGEVEGAPQPTRLHIPQNPNGSGPASPRSPIGGRLGAKLKGLTGLATSPTELAAAAQGKGHSLCSWVLQCH